jgi:hypothetical protein
MKLEFSRQIFEKNSQISNYMKIRPLGAELFHAGRRTAITKLRISFRNLANAPKMHLTSDSADWIHLALDHGSKNLVP